VRYKIFCRRKIRIPQAGNRINNEYCAVIRTVGPRPPYIILSHRDAADTAKNRPGRPTDLEQARLSSSSITANPSALADVHRALLLLFLSRETKQRVDGSRVGTTIIIILCRFVVFTFRASTVMPPIYDDATRRIIYNIYR